MRLDHVVHVVRDREAAAEAMRNLGLHAVEGGVHPHWGTQNALAYFDDLSYVEFIAVRDAAVAAASDFGSPILRFLEQGEGVGTVALRTADIEGDALRLRSRGIAIGPVREGTRRLPDGGMLTWRIALAPWPLPFLIEWGAPDEVRRDDLARRGALNPPGRRVGSVLWAVADLEEGLHWLQDGYGATVREPRADDRLQAWCVESDLSITLCAPAGPGPVQRRLTERGEGPLGYVLAGFGRQEARWVLGALIVMEG